MALTQVNADGVKDDAVTAGKIPADAISLAHLAAGTDGQVITYDASGNPVAVGPGTDGQVLTSTGAGSPPAFEALPASNNYTHPNHSGEVTSTADGAQVIADDVVDEANLKVSISPTNGQFLSAQSGNTGGLTWADAGGGKILKAVHDKNTSTHSTNSNHPQDAFTFTYTPVSATSTLIIHLMLPVDLNVTTEIQIVGKFSLHKNDDTQLAGTWLGQQHEYMNRNSSGHAPTCTANLMMIAKDTPGSTSEQTYKVKFGRQSGYNNRVAIRDHNFGGSAFGSMWSIFEVE